MKAALVLIAAAVLATAWRTGPMTPGHVGGSPLQLVSGRGSLWLLTCDRGCTGEARSSVGRLVRIEPRAGHVTASVRVARPQAIAVGPEGVFGLDFWRGDVDRLDPRTLHVTGRVHLVLPWSVADHDNAFLPETISLGAGSVWVTTNRGAVARIDPRSLRLLGVVRVEPGALDAVAASRGATWAAVELAGVARIDPHANRVTATVKIERGDRALSVGRTLLAGGRVLAIGDWTRNDTVTGATALARIDPVSLRVSGVTVLPGPRPVFTFAGGSLWAAREGGETINRIDPATGRVTARIRSGPVGVDLAVAAGSVWTASSTGTVTRVATVRGASR